MAARRSNPGHSVKISAETYARAVLAAAEVGMTEFADRSLLASIARQERWSQEKRYEEACRLAAERRQSNPIRWDYVKPVKGQ